LKERIDLQPAQLVSCPQITYLETEQSIDVDENQRVAAVNCKRADHIVEWTHFACDLQGSRIQHRKNRRPQARQVDALTVRRIDGIVRTGMCFALCNQVTGHRIPGMT